MFTTETKPQKLLTRQQAAHYISSTFGIPTATTTLDTKASIGGGPAFRIAGRRAMYAPADLEKWVAERLSRKVSSTSELHGGK